MRAAVDGTPLVWNASHAVPAGARIEIGGATLGSYGYLHVGGGFDLPQRLGSRSAHLAAGIGAAVQAGDSLAVGIDGGGPVGLCLPQDNRFDGGVLRVVESFQTDLFDTDTRERFTQTCFSRDARANRMGMRLNSDGTGFAAKGGLNILSESILPGDIQITGDGAPFVLLAECQTTGGYPRIGTVLPCDLPRVVQARPGESLKFHFVSEQEALEAERRHRADLAALPNALYPLIRDPHDIGDLLSYQLISGAIAGTEEDMP